jgi:hypothetical protein
VVKHKDREARLDLRCEEPSDIAFAAFYADCVHEVLPVTEGYRLALVYNLVRPGRGALPEPPRYAAQEDAVAGLLRQWTEILRLPASGEPEKLIYPLEHAYTPAELSFQALKGVDDGIARVVAAAAPRARCDVHLALVSIEEDGSAEHTSYSGWRRGRSGYDNEDDNEFEVIEVCNRQVSASDWRRPDGEPSPLTVIPVEDDELSPPEAFEGLAPDEQHFHEATGNEGASFERTYRRAALVLWPQERLFAVINQAGVEVTLPYLADLAERWVASGEGHDSPLWRDSRELSGQMVATWPMRDWQPSQDQEKPTSTGRMMGLLSRLGDLMRLESFLAMIAMRGGFDLGDSAAVADALRLLPPDIAATLLERIVRGAADRTLAACGALLAHAAVFDQAVVIGAARALVRALPSGPARDMWGRGPGVRPGFIVDLFVALARVDPGLADRAADQVLTGAPTYDFDKYWCRLFAICSARQRPFTRPRSSGCGWPASRIWRLVSRNPWRRHETGAGRVLSAARAPIARN